MQQLSLQQKYVLGEAKNDIKVLSRLLLWSISFVEKQVALTKAEANAVKALEILQEEYRKQ